jgi:hypothetical protein
MALIKLGPMVGGISGSIAATTFARNRAGYYARARTKPKIPVSTKRDVCQARLGDIIYKWQKVMTAPERALWNLKAAQQVFTNKVGDAYVPTGLNLYLRSAAQLDITAQNPSLVPPVTPVAPAFSPTLAYTTAVGFKITDVNLFPLTALGKILFYLQLNIPDTKTFYKGPWQDFVTFPIASLATLPFTILAPSGSAANTRCFFKFIYVEETGGVSAPLITYCDVGATP